jgi:RNA polymerase sigma-70 factor (ECF subfamily)
LTAESNKAERFVRHLEPLQAALEGFSRRALVNASDVEDVLQSAVMHAFRDFHLYVENTNFRAWMFRYVRLEVLNSNRRRLASPQPGPAVEREAEPSAPMHETVPGYERLLDAPETVLETCEQALAQAIRELPDVERDVLLLRAVGGFTYREVAEVLEVPIGSVMGRLSRARAAVRRRLAELERPTAK